MSFLTNLIGGIRALVRKKQGEREMDDELRAYVDDAAQEKMRSGMSPEEALRAARVEMGSTDAVKEGIRSAGWESTLETLGQDIRYGLRQLRIDPAFTTVAVVTLGLGIGVNAAIFTVVNRVLLRPLPYTNPDRLVWITDFIPRQNNTLVFDSDYFAWARQNQVFEGMAAYGGTELTLTGAGDSARLDASRVTAGFFSVLGVAPELGRAFLPDEDRPGGPQVCILSHKLWQSRFGANATLVGKAITLDGKSYTVLGVLPADFEFVANYQPELYIPFDLREISGIAPGEQHMIVNVIARMKPGIALERAESNLALINQGLASTYKGGYAKMMAGARAQVITLQRRRVGDVRLALLVLMGAVGFVLLIACANVANLQLARGVRREKEMALRAALGAGRGRLARQVLTESLLLAVLGGAAGVWLAALCVSALRMLGPPNIPHLADIQVDSHVLIFSAAVALLTGLVFGIFPVLAAKATQPGESLKESGVRGSLTPGRERTRAALVVMELALALVLLTGAGLLIRSFVHLTFTDPGFDPHNLLTARVGLPNNQYQQPAQQRAFFQSLLASLRTLPGVDSAEATVSLPFEGYMMMAGFEIAGHPTRTDVNQGAVISIVSPGYLHALGVPLVSGRNFTDQDSAGAPKVVVLNRTFARAFFGNDDPVGQRIQVAGEDWTTVAGVVGDLRQAGLVAKPEPEIFFPYLQMSYPEMAIVLRTKGEPLALTGALRARVDNLDRSLPVFDISTMDQIAGEQLASRKFNMALLGIFALVAVALAAVGIYGVMSYAVTQRTHEIGIRVALGAAQIDVLGLVLRQGIVLAAVGISIGLAGAFGLTRFLSSLLYGVRPTDAVTFIAGSCVLGGVALLAAYIPARRAACVDPLVALRHE